jgi:hypothetical protein
MNRRRSLALVGLLCLVLLASCLPGDGRNSAGKPAGFFMGVWHGIVAPVSLVVQVFKPSIRLYEVNNTGFWYDFGFWLALASGTGGGTAAASRGTRRRRDRA